MDISFIAIDRILEEKAATDPAVRDRLARKGKATLSTGRALSDEQLLAKLASLGLATGRDEFLRQAGQYLSAENMARAVYEAHPLREQDKDWAWIAYACLWERWSPERPSLEMIDDWMQAGYTALERRERKEACRLWLNVWRAVWAIVEARGLKTIEEFDALFRGTQSLFNWVQDLLMELGNAGRDDEALLGERLAILKSLLGHFRLDGLLRTNCRNDLGATYFAQGRVDQAEEYYRAWMAEEPGNGWVWIGWSDGYADEAPDGQKDLARAESLLRQGLAIPGVRDREELLLRLSGLYRRAGRAAEAKALEEETGRVEKARRAPAGPTALPPAQGLPAGWGLPPATPRAGRNDPCPCGRGKKYKKCCGRG